MQKSPFERIRDRASKNLICGAEDLGLRPGRFAPPEMCPADLVIAAAERSSLEADLRCAGAEIAALADGADPAALRVAVHRFFLLAAAAGHDDEVISARLVALGLEPRAAAGIFGAILADLGAGLLSS